MTNQYKVIFAVLTFCILFILPSNGNTEVTNKYCPVTTSELAEEKFSLEYKGDTIYFCCSNCKKDFIANPDNYLANLVIKNGNEQIESNDLESHAQSEKSAHDHATDHEQSGSLLTFIGKFHPLVIHFPIALVFTALFFTVLAVFQKIEVLNTFSIYLIYLAALSAVISAVFGLIAGSNTSYPSFLVSSFEWHRILGISSSLVTLITAYMGYRQLSNNPTGGVTLYRLVLLLNTILIGITGHLGATLVYGLDYFNF